MRKKFFIIIISLLFIISNVFLSSVYAANVCTLEAKSNKSDINKGEEFTINVSLKEINEGITGVGYTIEFDENVLEFVGQTVAKNWTVTKLETFCSYMTENYEATTTTGTLTDLKFKVKENSNVGSTAITLNAIEVVKDDTSSEKLNNISVNLNVVEQSSTPGKENEEENKPTEKEDQNGETGNTDNKPTEKEDQNGETGNTDNKPTEKEDQNGETGNTDNKPTEKEDQNGEAENTDNKPTEKENQNGETGNTDNKPKEEENQGEDKRKEESNKPSEKETNKENTSDKKLPNTGIRSGVILALIGTSVIVVVSYLKLSKYKGI